MGTDTGHAGKKEGEAEVVWKDCLERQGLAKFPFTKKQRGASGGPLVNCAQHSMGHNQQNQTQQREEMSEAFRDGAWPVLV